MEGLYVNRYKQAFLGFSVIFLMFFMIITIMFTVALSRFNPPIRWLAQISRDCPVSESLTELMFHNAVFVEYGISFYIFGCYIGLICDARQYKGSIPQLNQTSLAKTAARIVLSIIPIIPIYVCPLFLINSSRFLFVIMVIKYILPTFMIGFLLYGHSKVIYQRFNLVNDEDFAVDAQ